MAEVETAIPLPDILKMLGWSESKYYTRRKELEHYGVVFKRREGKPYVLRTYAFPYRIHKYIAFKARRGEPI